MLPCYFLLLPTTWRQGRIAPPVHSPIAKAASSSARSFSLVSSARSLRSNSNYSSHTGTGAATAAAAAAAAAATAG